MVKILFSLKMQENAFQQLLNAKVENTITMKLKNAYALNNNHTKMQMESA